MLRMFRGWTTSSCLKRGAFYSSNCINCIKWRNMAREVCGKVGMWTEGESAPLPLKMAKILTIIREKSCGFIHSFENF